MVHFVLKGSSDVGETESPVFLCLRYHEEKPIMVHMIGGE